MLVDTKMPLSETDLAEAIGILMESAESTAEIYQATQDDDLCVEHQRSFDDAGLLTYDDGVVLTLSDGTEFQVTVKQRS